MEEKEEAVADRTPAMLGNNPKAIAVYQHLKQQGITQNDKGEVTVQKILCLTLIYQQSFVH